MQATSLAGEAPTKPVVGTGLALHPSSSIELRSRYSGRRSFGVQGTDLRPPRPRAGRHLPPSAVTTKPGAIMTGLQRTAITNRGRRADRRRIVLSVALILGALGALIGGAFATFTASVTAGPQAITSGSVKLAVGPVTDVA